MTVVAQQLLVRDGFVYTADEAGTILPRGSILIRDGRIVAIGDSAGLGTELGEAATTTIDASGMMVLPGLVNPHWHEVLGRGLGRVTVAGTSDPVVLATDTADPPGPFALGGDCRMLSMIFDAAYGFGDALTQEEAAAIATYSLWLQLRAGTTTFGDVGSMNRPAALVAATERLGLRGAVSVWGSDGFCPPGERGFRRTREPAEVLQRLSDLHELVDGLERVRLLPSAIFGPNVSDQLLAGLSDLITQYDTPFAMHAASLAREDEVSREAFGQTTIQRLADHGLLSDRLIAVHAAWADPDDQQALRAARAHFSHSPAKYGTTGESGVSGTRQLLDHHRAGLDVSVSTDGEGMPLGGQPEAMRQAWLMHNEVNSDNTALTPTAVLAMASRVAARALRWSDEVGSLESGKAADLIMVPIDDWRYLLRPRPLEAFLQLGGSNDVDTVIVGGRVLLSGGRSTELDEQSLRDDFVAAVISVTERVFGVDPETVARLASRWISRDRRTAPR